MKMKVLSFLSLYRFFSLGFEVECACEVWCYGPYWQVKSKERKKRQQRQRRNQ